MIKKKLTLATAWRYDTKFLLSSEVRIEGFDIDYINTGPLPAPVFRDMVTTIPYDIGEQAFSHYVMAKDLGRPLTAVPVFPSRFFPQIGVTLNRDSKISEPSDLVGKRVGVMGFGYNPAVWMRGILAHQYDVSVERIIWVEDADDPSLAGLDYPRSRRFSIEKAQGVQQQSEEQKSGLLETGQIDALVAASGGPSLTERTKKLFDHPYQEIRKYLQDTSVFPINTVITLKEDVVESHPELPDRLIRACSDARRRYHMQADEDKIDHMGLEIGVLRDMGLFPDQYGLQPNRQAVRMMIEYCYEQGLIKTLFEPEDLFIV